MLQTHQNWTLNPHPNEDPIQLDTTYQNLDGVDPCLDDVEEK